MALSLSSISKLQPVHSNIELLATESAATSATVYTFKVYISGTLEATIKQKADPALKGELNLSSILENYFDSQVYMNASAVCEMVPGGVLKYKVDVTSSQTSTAVSTGDLYCFNGVVQEFETFDLNTYLMISTTNKGKFLTRWNGAKKVTMDSKAYLTALNGNFGLTSNPDFTGISVTIKQKDGTTKTTTSSYASSTPALLSIDVSPAKVNSMGTAKIDDNTIYYDVTERSGKGQPVRFYIEREQKIQDTFNILYLNSLGATEHFDFTKVSEENLDIKKDLFDQHKIRKIYNTDVVQSISVISDWITELQSFGLRDLWHSPAVKLNRGGKVNDILLKNSSVKVQNRFNNKLINYIMQFEYASKFRTQK
jgi:hypothetical protein